MPESSLPTGDIPECAMSLPNHHRSTSPEARAQHPNMIVTMSAQVKCETTLAGQEISLQSPKRRKIIGTDTIHHADARNTKKNGDRKSQSPHRTHMSVTDNPLHKQIQHTAIHWRRTHTAPRPQMHRRDENEQGKDCLPVARTYRRRFVKTIFRWTVPRVCPSAPE